MRTTTPQQMRPGAESQMGTFVSRRVVGWPAHLKMALEFLVALVLLVVTFPILVVAAVLVKLSSPGSVFYSQIRLGLDGAPFWLYKLRTMYENCERDSGPRWSTAGDTRITRLGEFLRRTHLDELPQLWNVLKGEMSLIGPRPERPEFVPSLAQAIPLYRERLVVLPGLTGLAQVNLHADTDLNSVRDKLAYDLHYIANESPWLDVRILVATVFKVLGVRFGKLRRRLAMPELETVVSRYEQMCAGKALAPEAAPVPHTSVAEPSRNYSAILLSE